MLRKEEIANKIILWKPLEAQGILVLSRTYIDNLLRNAGVGNTSELRSLMEDRNESSEGRPDRRPRYIEADAVEHDEDNNDGI